MAAIALVAAAPSPHRDPAEARIAAALVDPRLRASFQARLDGWRRRERACGHDAACRRAVDDVRRGVLSALAARISDDNPTLPDLEAAAFIGRWQASRLRSLDGVVRPYPLSDAVPEDGQRVTGRAGELCLPDCLALGLEPHPLGEAADEQAAASALNMPSGGAAWLAYLDGRAGWLAIPAANGIALLVTSCVRPRRDCGPAIVMLRPLTAGSAIVTLPYAPRAR